MSVHDDRFAAGGIAPLFAQQGTSGCTYTPAGGVAATLTAILGEKLTDVVPTDRGTRKRTTRTAVICRDPSGDYGGVADPDDAATFTDDDGIEYAIEDGGVDTDTHTATLRLLKTGRVEVSQTEYDRG